VEGSDNEIISTDFYNYRTPYIDFRTGDVGSIEIKECQCGIYGRVLTSFTGRSMQCLCNKQGMFCDPQTIMSIITSIWANFSICSNFAIHQLQNGQIMLYTKQDNNIKAYNEAIFTIQSYLINLLNQTVEIHPYNLIPNNRNKLLLISSAMKNIN
jgi:phenylacetate-coenzyme A ligase PaaK-like adenylate-forming protein